MGCAWFGPKVTEPSKLSHERRSLTWRATGVVALRDEGLTDIPKIAFEQGPLVKALDASHNKLEYVDDGITYLNKLQRLTLSNNKLNFLNDRIVQLSKLRVLILNDNHLRELPSTIGRLTQLEHLNLENNELRMIPESIGYMTRLHTLHLGRNKLKTLPETIGGCFSLEEIDATKNQLEKLPEYICKLEILKVLLVDNNLIEELPQKLFTDCKMLATFSIHKNPIETKTIQSIPNFKEYNERRVQKYDKQIYGGGMKENLSFDEGFDKDT
ncbi:leucine-rich repeat domain-containing protein [Chloropicon primus]|uniref:Leucine-rich repeat domain-containing protein n=1 Tax=Chloropicon primus TaxID=1764295 RepID=A0A5B8MAY4_9CHLO|nr:leucine-rich repeat domain-containing protein [Chloropicon primus]UPQ96745.1 leucine-rich repeat domain-containing protein [Chloropicon primus]|mmetsp:Transcript_5305/g.16003  ORF Transcript_5305/g.16003 Transcript_5305/m.16003 type:complete len:270 (-) Transcript_5305:173-982(-)|eukprot:QDZ17526.1 leucine-rich repeat domain-containing protein [Chloropicon primus]